MLFVIRLSFNKNEKIDIIVQINKIVTNIKNYVDKLPLNEYKLQTFTKPHDYLLFFQDQGIDVALNANKEIILREETSLELGGHHKESFSTVIPFQESNLIKDGSLTLIGPTVTELRRADFSKIDFGLLVFLELAMNDEESLEKKIKYFNFIGDSIEGFLIRTIPRRFWCRISSEIIDTFSFELLGHAIGYLYKEKFPDFVKAVEIIMISSHADLVKNLQSLTSEYLETHRKKWKEKVDKWKKTVGCDYDWGCSICPDKRECYDVKRVLMEREHLEE